ncbi:hypothetical protein E2C01_064159 [Portunus trituberculatus]|uniref:Uncharacterized protein n=1 Tax=Portunus trituberculatus TaxID=210409 RepID=A0A5B7HJ01_PORTR|nr:hypothetical protein [Portunus trituberculatus]
MVGVSGVGCPLPAAAPGVPRLSEPRATLVTGCLVPRADQEDTQALQGIQWFAILYSVCGWRVWVLCEDSTNASNIGGYSETLRSLTITICKSYGNYYQCLS